MKRWSWIIWGVSKSNDNFPKRDKDPDTEEKAMWRGRQTVKSWGHKARKPTRSWKKSGRFFPGALGGAWPSSTLILDFAREYVFVILFRPTTNFVVVCHSSQRKNCSEWELGAWGERGFHLWHKSSSGTPKLSIQYKYYFKAPLKKKQSQWQKNPWWGKYWNF